MGSFVYKCSETKKTINENDKARISFFIERALLNKNRPHHQSSLPVPFCTLDVIAKDYGQFETPYYKGLSFLEKLHNCEILKTTPEVFVLGSIYDTNFSELDRFSNLSNSKYEDDNFSFLKDYKQTRHDETNIESVLSSLISLEDGIDKDIINYAFNATLYHSLNNAFFIRFNDKIYSIYACIYSEETISNLNHLMIEDIDGEIVNEEAFISKTFQRINHTHNKIDHEWFNEFEKAGLIMTPHLKDIVLSCNSSQEILSLMKQKFKDELNMAFLLKMGISTDVPSILTGTQDYESLNATSMAQQITISFQ